MASYKDDYRKAICEKICDSCPPDLAQFVAKAYNIQFVLDVRFRLEIPKHINFETEFVSFVCSGFYQKDSSKQSTDN